MGEQSDKEARRWAVAAAHLPDHPMRAALVEEVHARPFASLQAPERASHLALMTGEGGAAADHAHLVYLCERHGVPAPPESAKHLHADFGPFRLKWERHGEFCTYTFLRRGAYAHPFAVPAIALVPFEWLERLPGKRLVAVHLALQPSDWPIPDSDALASLFRLDTICAGRLAGGAALAWTDFAVHDDGFGRILVHDAHLTPHGAGRMVQRLLEIETYRMTALLGLPVVQENAPRIRRIEEETAEIARTMGAIARLEDTRATLERLSRLSADLEGIAARTNYRLDATRAYYALVRRRIERLREERVEGFQTIGEFMERRLVPAMQTCDTAAKRQEALLSRLARATDLLRTRVNVALEEQNRDLLLSMDRRSRLQQRLQRTLEVISMIALTYYLSVLLTTVLRAVKAAGAALDVEAAAGAAVPLMLGLVWLGIQWARRAAIKSHERDKN